MTHNYHIQGMTCNNCVAKVKSELLKIGEVTAAEVQLTSPQAIITMSQHIPLETLQSAITKAGSYTITEADGGMQHQVIDDAGKTWLETYKPIHLIFLYISLISAIESINESGINWMHFMRIFMSGFFLAFSFFKMLDLRGFAANYSTYDIIANKFMPWGYIYAFIELGLGLSYAMDLYPIVINAITFIVMSLSIIGVLQSVLNKRKIQCACLGAVFNLPMSTVTIIEDALMILMSGIMLIYLI